MSDDSNWQASRRYQITVQGELDPNWSDWFSGMDINHETISDGSSMTTLTGVIADQPALRGILHKLWDLNLVLDSIRLVSASDPSLSRDAVGPIDRSKNPRIAGAHRKDA